MKKKGEDEKCEKENGRKMTLFHGLVRLKRKGGGGKENRKMF